MSTFGYDRLSDYQRAEARARSFREHGIVCRDLEFTYVDVSKRDTKIFNRQEGEKMTEIIFEGDRIMCPDFSRFGCGQEAIDDVYELVVEKGAIVEFVAEGMSVHRCNYERLKGTIAKYAEAAEEELFNKRERKASVRPNPLIKLWEMARAEKARAKAELLEKLKGFPPKTQQAVIMYRDGMPLRSIGKYMGISHIAVRNRLKQAGEPLRPRSEKKPKPGINADGSGCYTPLMMQKFLREVEGSDYVPLKGNGSRR